MRTLSSLFLIFSCLVHSNANGSSVDCNAALSFHAQIDKSGDKLSPSLEDLWQSPDESRWHDSQFVAQAIDAIEDALKYRPGDYDFLDFYKYHAQNYHFASQILGRLVQYPQNYESLLPALQHLLIIVAKNRTVRASHALDLLTAFCPSPVFRSKLPEILAVVLKNIDLNGAGNFLAVNFKYLDDEALRQQIIDHFLLELREIDVQQRDGLYYFATLNPAIEAVQNIPLALGVEKNLGNLGVKTGSLAYQEWESVGWMEESKSIKNFDQIFQVAVSQTAAVNFEVGPLLKDIPALKKALAQIRARGPGQVLEELADIYERAGGERRPILNRGRVSITDLELFWILQNPEFLAKTTFFKNYKPLSKGQMQALITKLSTL